MSRHRIFQNYDYENELDDYDGEGEGRGEGEEEQEELSPEDKVQMAEGTAEVTTILGAQVDKVTTQQIQEALWHYYYDIDKTVAYLIGKFVDPAPRPAAKPKAQAKPSEGTGTARGTYAVPSLMSIDLPQPTGVSEADFSSREPSTSMATFFSDMPWLHIPEDRKTVLVGPPRIRGGLLGGSSTPKMSKLQALAAARKRKADEEAALVMLPKRAQQPPLDESPTMEVSQPETQEVTAQDNDAERGPTSRKKSRNERAPQQEPRHDGTQEAVPHASVSRLLTDGASDEYSTMAKPSAFAQVLCFGPASATPTAPSSLPSPHPVQVDLLPPWAAFTTPEALRAAFEQPSPDDVVLAAQSKSALTPLQQKTGKKATKPNKSVAEAVSGVENLKVDDTAPLPKSKNLDVLKEHASSKGKKELSFVVVGHVDSGKSTMLGRLLLDMKVVDQRTIDKYQKEAEKLGKSSFALAWVLDSRAEERTRGVTIDIATNHFETDSTSFTLIDAPGHRDFIPNMLAGTGMADIAVLVVDAAKGAFEAGLKGQTREHALLLRSMGVFRIVVAVNKLDTTKWSTERFEEIRDQILGSLKALKFPLKDISFVPVSGLKGDNVVRRSQDPSSAWYSGPTILEELEQSESKTTAEDLTKPLRLMITDLYDTPLSPIVVSGRIDAGSLQVGDAVLVQPSGEKAYIKAIERNDASADWAVAGQHVALHLSHTDAEKHLHTGDVLCSIRNPIPCVDSFTMRALAFDTFFPMPVDLSRGRLRAPAFVRELTGTLDINKGTVLKKRPQIVKAGQVARIKVSTEDGKVPMEKGLRVVLRSEGNTVAAGLIE